jgi:hypothetical protein
VVQFAVFLMPRYWRKPRKLWASSFPLNYIAVGNKMRVEGQLLALYPHSNQRYLVLWEWKSETYVDWWRG